MTPETPPELVREKISLISKRTGISEEELNRAYSEIFVDPFIQTDPQFKDEEERQRYAAAVLWTRYIARPPVREYEIVPVGYGPTRMTRNGRMVSLFALTKFGGDIKLKRIVLREQMIEDLKVIQYFARYVVKLGQFSSGDLIADSRTRWENPIAVQIDPHKTLEKLGAKRITVKGAESNQSKRGSDGYVDETDWRVIRGLVAGKNSGKTQYGREWGVYTIADETCGQDTRVTSDGRVLRPGFTVWVNPEAMIYDEESECDFVGTVQMGTKTGTPFMNCYLILPIHSKKVEV